MYGEVRLVERPEFYNACDEFGILVFQDLWGSGDCNGAWEDPTKMDSRERRWEYPDNHDLFIASVEDQVKMIRNHPSLCFWCGANEWPLAKDIDQCLRKEVFPQLDPERLFVSFSTDTLFTRNYLGDNGDGPYGIQEPEWFFSFRSHPFNPEAGSVGSPEVESFRAFMPEEDLKAFPRKSRTRNPNWIYHKDLGYGDHLERYGELQTIEDYCRYAQLVNYDQYRSFMEGWASHMWDWYTGILIWKTQNPWTALRGQMYDWYLDVNASLYGTKKGCEPLHPFYNLVTKQVQLLNTTVEAVSNLTVKAEIFNREGKKLWEQSAQANAEASQVKDIFAVPVPPEVSGVYFLKLSLMEWQKNRTDPQHLLADHHAQRLPDIARAAEVITEYKKRLFTKDGNTYTGKTVFTADAHISFFNRIKLFDKQTGKRILPVHYSDNYITLMPGDQQTVTFSFQSELPESQIEVVVEGFNK